MYLEGSEDSSVVQSVGLLTERSWVRITAGVAGIISFSALEHGTLD